MATWNVLSVIGGAEAELDAELGSRGISTFLPRFRVEHFSQRKTKIVTVDRLLMPGYLLVGSERAALPRLQRHEGKYRFLDGMPVADSAVQALAERVRHGEFDVRLARTQKQKMPTIGARVRVLLLGMTGQVIRRAGRFAEVLLDGINSARTVMVEPHGMVPV